MDFIQDSISKHIPTKIRKSGNKKKNGPIWMNRQAIKAVKKKHKSWKKYRQSGEHIHYQYYCRERNNATREVTLDKNWLKKIIQNLFIDM